MNRSWVRFPQAAQKRPPLQGWAFSFAHEARAALRGVALRGVALRGAVLRGAVLRGVALRGVATRAQPLVAHVNPLVGLCASC